MIRIYEWSTDYGMIRMGIPRRLDDQVRLEILHARFMPPVTQPNWGVEELR